LIKDLDTKIKRNLIQLIKRKLIHIDFPFDIIIQSASDFEKKKSDKGYLTYYVVKEGVKIMNRETYKKNRILKAENDLKISER